MARDEKKTKAQLVDELKQLRARLSRLESKLDSSEQSEEACDDTAGVTFWIQDALPADHIGSPHSGHRGSGKPVRLYPQV